MSTQLNFKNRTLKLALVSAFALGATMSGQSFAAEGVADTSAQVLTPIVITNNVGMAFGSFAPGAGGSVTVSTNGARTASGTILSELDNITTAAKFTVQGDAGATYDIAIANTDLIMGDETMALATFSDFDAGGVTTGTVAGTGTGTLTGGTQTIFVGGTLTVAAAQAAGIYAGTVTVTVEYN